MAPPDLDARLDAIDAETAELGLERERELVGKLPGGDGVLVVRSYKGVDAVGRPVHAVRAATARGVVLALGPLEAQDAERTQGTELVVSLLPAPEGDGAWRSATDLNQDGRLDVVLRNEAGELEVWGVSPTGANRYDVLLAVPATRAADVDDDGVPDLAGERVNPPEDPLTPLFDDVATFQDGRYVNTSPAARGMHRRQAALREAAIQAERDAAEARKAPQAADRASASKPPLSEAARVRRALEWGWHALLAGDSRDRVLDRLDQEPVSAALRGAFLRHRATLVSLRVTRPTSGSRAEETPGGT
jgi:hypothetical protein